MGTTPGTTHLQRPGTTQGTTATTYPFTSGNHSGNHWEPQVWVVVPGFPPLRGNRNLPAPLTPPNDNEHQHSRSIYATPYRIPSPSSEPCSTTPRRHHSTGSGSTRHPTLGRRRLPPDGEADKDGAAVVTARQVAASACWAILRSVDRSKLPNSEELGVPKPSEC